MTKKELIAKLSSFPDDAELFIYIEDMQHFWNLDVEPVMITEQEAIKRSPIGCPCVLENSNGMPVSEGILLDRVSYY